MEKTDFPNAVGILFTAKGHGEKLAVLLEQLRPDNSQILSANEERYLVLCPRLPDRVILRLTDKVKKMASMDKEPYEVESAYIIRKDGEFYTIQFEDYGRINLRGSRLYHTEEEARKRIKPTPSSNRQVIRNGFRSPYHYNNSRSPYGI